LKERFFKDNLVGNGSIFSSITKGELLNQEFIVASDELVKKYNEIAIGIDKKIDILDSQIQLLSQARDRLLPKLMSGELEV
jgi:type I restriction enzyme S subunit